MEQVASNPFMNTKPKIGVVGLGRMGANMARRLKDCGFEIASLHDVRPGVAAGLAEELGARACGTLAEVTAHAEVVLTVVTDDAAMRSVFASTGDSLLTGAAGRIFVNCATVSPAVHAEVEGLAEAAGAKALEGCMASSITQAREGSLYLMVGGRREVFESVRPVLEALSSSMRYIGGAGEAAKVKALVNMVMNIHTAALAEGLGLADALGLDLAMIREVFSQTGAASRVLVTDGEDMQHREHSCFFSAAHAAKDSGIALGLARQAGLDLPLAQATKAQFDRMVSLGLGELDKSGIAELTFRGRGPGAV
ncbi:MAG: 2-hydroxy-3-oxopropionate reductase [Verrucomicrobiota bacterium]